jgi:hypothetical protein
MSDDFEDDLPIEEEDQADDFDNFDPQKYLRRRQATRGNRDDTGDFDRDLPMTSRRGRSYGDLNDPRGYDQGRGASRRGRHSVADDDNSDQLGNAAGMGAGVLASIIGLFTGENMGLFNRILPELGPRLGPLARWVVGAVGCIIVFICGLACVGVYFIYTVVNHR